MTKDEALQILDTIPTISEQVDALEMAIKALEQQPSDTVSRGAFEQVMWERDIAIRQLKELGYEFGAKIGSCEDAISRQAVFKIQAKYAEYIGATKFWQMSDDIKALPSVTPQPKTGHWILTSDDDLEYCTCSECGYQNGENWMIGSQIKFCQECGAKMQESEEV